MYMLKFGAHPGLRNIECGSMHYLSCCFSLILMHATPTTERQTTTCVVPSVCVIYLSHYIPLYPYGTITTLTKMLYHYIIDLRYHAYIGKEWLVRVGALCLDVPSLQYISTKTVLVESLASLTL